MLWDPALLRKFSSTGHFRLLNQLRSDLKKRPLGRDSTSGELKMPGSTRQVRAVSTRSAPAQRQPQHVNVDRDPLPASVEETPRTFRERLNAIDMR